MGHDCSRRRTITVISTSEPARAINSAIVMVGPANAADSAAQPPPQLVFVYGSLKQGMANHHHLAGATYHGTAELPGLHLYDLGPFPMAVTTDASDAALRGEIYGVSPKLLGALDRFEGSPRLYERQRHALADGRAVWVYVGRHHQVRHVQRIRCGSWSGPGSQGNQPTTAQGQPQGQQRSTEPGQTAVGR